MSLETVVVGLDMSPQSMLAARWTASHFAPDARLVLVHATEERAMPSFLEADEFREKVQAAQSERVERELSEFADQFGRDRVRVVARKGRAATVLRQIADEEDADLLTLGAHRRRALVGSVLGSTASQILSEAERPVLVAHGLGTGKPGHLLAAIDDSPARINILAWAESLAKQFDATGTVLYAIEPPGVDLITTLFASMGEFREERERISELGDRWLEGVMAEEGLDTARFRSVVSFGRPALEIVSAADRVGAELIVMGTRGRGRPGAFTLGSVAREVLESSGCPVLILPPKRS